jgi:hypothetical protein
MNNQGRFELDSKIKNEGNLYSLAIKENKN